jgi:AraC family transcriptional regulator
MRYEGGFYDPLLESVLRSLMMEIQAPAQHAALLMQGFASAVAARLIHKYTGTPAQDGRHSPRRKGLDARRLRWVHDYIDANLERDLTIDELANVACLSQYHFARLFKRAMGRTVHRHLVARRLERAKQLLASAEPSLADIASRCSFSSQANFTKAFVRAIGITPGRYRQTRTD